MGSGTAEPPCCPCEETGECDCHRRHFTEKCGCRFCRDEQEDPVGSAPFVPSTLTFDDVKAAWDLRLVSVADAWDSLDDSDSPDRAAARDRVCEALNRHGVVESCEIDLSKEACL